MIEHITVVVILLTNGVIFFVESLVEQRLVVEVALFDAKLLHQSVRGIDRISHPGDVADVVLFALIEMQINIDVSGINRHHRVAHH